MSEPLRQPRTFWQWLSGQEGSLFVPPPPPIQRVMPARSALDVIEDAISRIHIELEAIREDDDSYIDNDSAYKALANKLDLLHGELARRSQEESKNVNNTQ